MTDPVISLDSTGVLRSGKWILRDLSLTFESGILAVIGASGSGKTTLVSLLAGLEKPHTGHAKVLGYNLSNRAEVHSLHREIGLVMQQPRQSLPPSRKILDIVAEPLVVHERMGREAARSKAADTLEGLGLGPSQWNRSSSWLSGGECQRVSLARCLVRPVRLILADEPTASLDSDTAATILKLLSNAVSSRSCSMVYVTHRWGDTQALNCEVIELENGRMLKGIPHTSARSQPPLT